MSGQQGNITDEDVARFQAVQDISSGVLKVIVECLNLHGSSDPNAPIIVAAGLHMAIDTIAQKVDPNITARLIKCLQGSA